MTSPAQMRSNAENAKKSTGPRTGEGKQRARVNAVKHGMTARVALLPEENFPEFKVRMVGIFEHLRPKSPLEAALAERVAYSFVRSERASRAQTARLNRKAQTGAQEEADRTEQEVRELTQMLFRPPVGRTAAHPYAEQQGGTPVEVRTDVVSNGRDHPALVVGRLEGSALGCDWLRARWEELGALLEDGLNWRAPERFRVFRLLGIHPSDALFTNKLTTLLQACETLDPGAGSLVAEIWNAMVSAEALPGLLETYERETRHSRTWDEASARQYLLGVVNTAIARLDAKEEFHALRANVESDLAQELGSFDESREGALMRRYEQACDRELHKNLAELRVRQAERESRGVYGFGPPIARPSPSWLPGMDSVWKSMCENDLSDDADICGDDDAYETAERDEVDSFSASSVEMLNEPSGADSEIATTERWAEDALRNEPSTGFDGCEEAEGEQEGDLRNEASRNEVDAPVEGSEAASVLRNEPSQAGTETADAGCEEGSAQRNEPRSAAQMHSQHAAGDQVGPENVATTTLDMAETVVEGARAAVFPGIRRDRAHENLIEASRRERRKRKRDERRARSRSH